VLPVLGLLFALPLGCDAASPPAPDAGFPPGTTFGPLQCPRPPNARAPGFLVATTRGLFVDRPCADALAALDPSLRGFVPVRTPVQTKREWLEVPLPRWGTWKFFMDELCEVCSRPLRRRPDAEEAVVGFGTPPPIFQAEDFPATFIREDVLETARRFSKKDIEYWPVPCRAP